MDKFVSLTAIAAPVMRANIDTDVIIPSREMKGVTKTGLSVGMFANWRYTDVPRRVEDPAFVLNREPFRKAQILLAGTNFGCGSSREHAVWAMREWGFRAVIAPSFGAIYFGNCVRNGILPVVLAEADVARIAAWVEAAPDANHVSIDLPSQTVTAAGGSFRFQIGEADKLMLLEGLDPIGVTLKKEPEIAAFEARDRTRRPWVYELGRS
ncbi:MAG: 3-isopropylmalate dehydratase small subunit [Alphaproteobacteria bacterium]|nr:3-isopropylmalate dehydratase small subunit [Alphaproteobacteria bacterium]